MHLGAVSCCDRRDGRRDACRAAHSEADRHRRSASASGHRDRRRDLHGHRGDASHRASPAPTSHYAHWSAWWQILLLGLVVGAVTQAARLAGGTLLVPALFFLTAMPDRLRRGCARSLPAEAVIEALIVVFLRRRCFLPGATRSAGWWMRPICSARRLPGRSDRRRVRRLAADALLERSILVVFGVSRHVLCRRARSRAWPWSSRSAPTDAHRRKLSDRRWLQ